MRKFKVFFCLFIAVFMIVSAMTPVFAHSGRTDSNGGHWDHSNGTYHYHNNGSGSSSNSSSSSSSSNSSSSAASGCNSLFSILGVIIIIVVILGFVLIFKYFMG